jgi:hypothetical protein
VNERSPKHIGKPWEEMPEFFKRGSYFARRNFTKSFTDAEWDALPEIARSKMLRSAEFNRTEVVELDLPILSTLPDPEFELFGIKVPE